MLTKIIEVPVDRLGSTTLVLILGILIDCNVAVLFMDDPVTQFFFIERPASKKT